MEICKCTRRLGGTTMLRFVSLIIFLLEEGERFSLCVSIYLIKTGQKKNSGGHYGIYLGDSLYYVSSAPCPTFNNDPLFLSIRRNLKLLQSNLKATYHLALQTLSQKQVIKTKLVSGTTYSPP